LATAPAPVSAIVTPIVPLVVAAEAVVEAMTLPPPLRISSLVVVADAAVAGVVPAFCPVSSAVPLKLTVEASPLICWTSAFACV
jgi:hypothetical protein